MKCAVSALLLLASLPAFSAGGPLQSLERVWVQGREYVRLSDWARLQGFQARWLSKQDFSVTGTPARLHVTVDSQRAQLNGVTLWLSAPVALYQNTACVAPGDLKATIHPILWPAKNRSGTRLKHVCLDPGHGGKDVGNREGRQNEKDYTLLFARELSAQLRKAGYKVTLTRSWDTFVELEDRVELARRLKADLFLSLHFNAADSNPEAKGAEVYCLTPAHTASTNARGEGANTGAFLGNLHNDRNVLLAYHLQKALVSKLGQEDRGVRRARFAVLRTARMPAALIESGFMSNATEIKKIASPTWRKQLAQAVVEGVKNYQRMVEPAK